MMRVLLLAVLALLILQPAAAREFSISHQWPAEHDARDRAVRIFATEVHSRLPDVTFRIYPELSLKIKAEDQFEALQNGALDMSVYVLPYAVKKVPEFSLAVLPGLYPSVQTARALQGSKVSDQLQAVANAHGVHIVAWFGCRAALSPATARSADRRRSRVCACAAGIRCLITCWQRPAPFP